MTLLERLSHFRLAATSQEDERSAEDLINEMTPYELLAEISEALAFAGVSFNMEF